MCQTLLLVALGGALGSALRHLVNVGAMRAFGPGFPVATLTVNVAGCFLMGTLVVALAHWGGQRHAPFLMTGLLGGFTTFSAFALDAVTLWQRGEAAVAAGYVLASVLVSLVALLAGMAVARGMAA